MMRGVFFSIGETKTSQSIMDSVECKAPEPSSNISKIEYYMALFTQYIFGAVFEFFFFRNHYPRAYLYNLFSQGALYGL